MKNKYLYLLLLLAIVLVASCSDENRIDVYSFSGATMGTTYSVKIAYSNPHDLKKLETLKASVDSVLKVVNQQMSTYIQNSEISSFNNYKGSEWFTISPDFARVLDESVSLGKLSNGSLDITIGPLVNLWGFGPDAHERVIPPDSEIKQRLSEIGLDKIEVRLSPPAVKKHVPDLHCDLSATAKGFGVDKVSEFILSKGFGNLLVEIGGEVRGFGRNQNNLPWQVGISQPDQSGRVERVVGIENMAMATSGDYWNYFEENGVRYSHTIDPRTGRPITHKLASVTVVSKNCLTADGLATAINVMGPEEGMKFASEKELPVYMIIKEGKSFIIKESPKFIELFDRKADK